MAELIAARRRPVGAEEPRRARRSIRCGRTRKPTRPTLVCQVAAPSSVSVALHRRSARHVEAARDWMDSAPPTSRRTQRKVRRGMGRSPRALWRLVAMEEGVRRTVRDYLPPLLELLGLAELEQEPGGTNRMRAATSSPCVGSCRCPLDS